MLTRARVIKGAIAASTFDRPLPASSAEPGKARRVPAPIVDAHVEAKRIVERARHEAAAIVEAASTNAQMAARAAADEAREAEIAKLAARALAIRVAEESAAARDLDRCLALAVVLAERLLGSSLEIVPSRIAELAKQALEEARGTRVTKIRAHPLDVEPLRTNLGAVTAAVVNVEPDASLGRGSLVVETNLGTLDAQLTPQLERLAAALREHVARVD